MVYCGKPSKGCGPCRQKRTKCDLLLPSCTQCLRTGRYCTGYRSPEGLQIRDQSRDVITKQERRLTPSGSFPQNALRASGFNSTAQSPAFPNLFANSNSIPASPTFFPEDGAASFFFNDYIAEDTPTPSNIFQRLPLLFNQAPVNSPLAASITALGLATMSTACNAPHLMLNANMTYSKALSKVNSALRDPVRAKDDETLIIVMLLGLFEEINTTTKTMDPWTSHVKGALALLDYRGPSQLERPIGVQAISMIRLQIVVNCLVRRVHVPESIHRWAELARAHEEKEEDICESEMGTIMSNFCNLQADISSSSLPIDPNFILARCYSLENDLINWASTWEVRLPFSATTVSAATKSPIIFTDHYHTYTSIHSAVLWNSYRAIRIQLYQIILTYMAFCPSPPAPESFEGFEPQTTISSRTIITLSHEACATVHYFMDPYSGSLTVESAYHPKNNARAKLLIWPLYIAGQTDFVSEIMRAWIADQLDFMGNLMAIGKAGALAALLRMKQRPEPKTWRDLGMENNRGDVSSWASSRESSSLAGGQTDETFG